MDGALSKLLKPPTSQRTAQASQSVTKPVVHSEKRAGLFGSEERRERCLPVFLEMRGHHRPSHALATPSQHRKDATLFSRCVGGVGHERRYDCVGSESWLIWQ